MDIGFRIILTMGSRWEFWETEHLYRRSPRVEGPREFAAWGGPEAGPAQDFLWHEFDAWKVVDYGVRAPRLVIFPVNGGIIRAPYPDAPIGDHHKCMICPGDGLST